jgi:hypothetical protein
MSRKAELHPPVPLASFNPAIMAPFLAVDNMGIRKPGIGKSKRRLTNATATKTTNTLNLKIEKYNLGAYGNSLEPSPCCPSHQHLSASTNRATELLPFMTDHEGDVSPLISRPHIIVADKTKSMVHKTRGHASPPIIGNLQQFPFGVVCPFFATYKKYPSPG